MHKFSVLLNTKLQYNANNYVTEIDSITIQLKIVHKYIINGQKAFTDNIENEIVQICMKYRL